MSLLWEIKSISWHIKAQNLVPPSYFESQIWKGLLAKYHISNFLLSMPATLVLKCHENLRMEIFFSFWTDTTDVVSTHRNRSLAERYIYEAVFKQNKNKQGSNIADGLLKRTGLCAIALQAIRKRLIETLVYLHNVLHVFPSQTPLLIFM